METRDLVDTEKHKVLNMHYDCENISQNVKNSQYLLKVVKIKQQLFEILQSPAFDNKDEECISKLELERVRISSTFSVLRPFSYLRPLYFEFSTSSALLRLDSFDLLS